MTTLSDDTWTSAGSQALLDAFVALRNRDEAAAFLRDLCTRQEIDEMVGRWSVVQLLASGISYREIHERTGVSTATVTRINEWLRHGTGGYRMMLHKLARKGRAT